MRMKRKMKKRKKLKEICDYQEGEMNGKNINKGVNASIEEQSVGL